jgi:hypothetical protein
MPVHEKGTYSAYGAFGALKFDMPTHDKGAYGAYGAYGALKFGKPAHGTGAYSAYGAFSAQIWQTIPAEPALPAPPVPARRGACRGACRGSLSKGGTASPGNARIPPSLPRKTQALSQAR